jgi:hypothetical protein
LYVAALLCLVRWALHRSVFRVSKGVREWGSEGVCVYKWECVNVWMWEWVCDLVALLHVCSPWQWRLSSLSQWCCAAVTPRWRNHTRRTKLHRYVPLRYWLIVLLYVLLYDLIYWSSLYWNSMYSGRESQAAVGAAGWYRLHSWGPPAR